MLCAAAVFADGTEPKRGFQPANSYAEGDFETVNTTNGNVVLHFPLGSLPAGRGGLSAQISLVYNSKLYDAQTQYYCDPDLSDPDHGQGQLVQKSLLNGGSDGGWKYAVGYSYHVEDRSLEYPPNLVGLPGCSYFQPQKPALEATYLYKLKMSFPDGSTHEMRLFNYSESSLQDGYFNVRPDGLIETSTGTTWTNQTLVYYSLDGSFARLEIQHDGDDNPNNNPWTLYLNDGTRVTSGLPLHDDQQNADVCSGECIFDRNNNRVEIKYVTNYNGTSQTATQLVDQLGRTVTLYSESQGVDAIQSRGFGEDLVWHVTHKDVWVRKQYNTAGADTMQSYPDYFGQSLGMVDQIILPAQAGQLSYTFGYDGDPAWSTNESSGWGELNSVTTPSGAQVAYTYGMSVSGDLPKAKDVLTRSLSQKTLSYNQEYNGASTPVTETWTYNIGPTSSFVTAPDGGVSSEYYGDTTKDLYDAGVVNKSIGPDGTVVERIWQRNNPVTLPPRFNGLFAGANLYVKTEFTSIKSGNDLVKTAIKDYSYDKNGNVTRVAEYDWVDYASVPRDQTGKVTGEIPSGAPLKRVTATDYYASTPDAASAASPTGYEYQYSSSPQDRTLPRSSEVSSPTQIASRTEYTYDAPYTTGNLTGQKSWDSTKGTLDQNNPVLTVCLPGATTQCNAVSVSYQYDSYGNRKLATDALGHQTKYIFGAVNSPSGAVTDLYPTQVKTAYGTAVEQTTTAEYDFSTGLVTRSTDANGVATRTDYDAFGRPTLVTAAEGRGEETRAETVYSDVGRYVITRQEMCRAGDAGCASAAKLVGVTHYDQLGRERLSRTLEDPATQSETDEQAGIKVQTRYRFSGQNGYVLVSNHYRAATSAAASSETTMGWTVTKADQAGRTVEERWITGAGLPAPWGTNAATTGAVATSYDANFTTVTDQAGKTRRSSVNALGQLVRVDEPKVDAVTQAVSLGSTDAPVQPTCYSYDALSNLVEVRQGGQWQSGQCQGGQVRSFQYSSLSRLMSGTNPENGTISYEYDATGNLKKKIDPRLLPGGQTHVTTTINYDEQNRITGKTYNDGTPAVAYFYDGQALPAGAPALDRGLSAGRLVATTYGGGAEGSYVGYDALGRVVRSSQQTGGTAYTFPSYGYDRAGHLVSETYPTGRVVTTTYDASGDVSGVTGKFGTGTAKTYASNFHYAAHGAVDAVKLGNGLWESAAFNARRQPLSASLGTANGTSDVWRADYDYGTTDDTGDVRSQTVTAPGLVLQQSYTYDELSRLKTAREVRGATETWRQAFLYPDAYGNRRLDAANTSTPWLLGENPQISAATNRISDAGYSYDDAGNLTAKPGGATYSYDAENRMASANTGQALGLSTYTYDGDGRRVRKLTGSGSSETLFVYDAAGRMIAEYASATAQANGTQFLTQDALGTPRVVTDANQAVKARTDYLPFGESIDATATGRSAAGYGSDAGERQKFTGKERDSETGLDYFLARYYSSAQGRFVSSDPLLASGSCGQPQSWNRYAYVLNNPYRYVDPNGKWTTEVHNWIIDHALPGLSSQQRQVIKKASHDVDYESDSFDSDNAYKHGLRKSGESVDEAADHSDEWLSGHMYKAQSNPGSNDSLYQFGLALHTATDETSPSHIGYQIWRGLISDGAIRALPSWAIHGLQETRSQGFNFINMGFALAVAQHVYSDTYGRERLNQATGGIALGSANDPTVREIERSIGGPSLSYGNTVEADLGLALHQYRMGIAMGRVFDYHRQSNLRQIMQ